MTLTGEVLERRDGRWRTVRLGNAVRVNDRRRVDPLGLTPEQRAASDRAAELRKVLGSRLGPLDEMVIDALSQVGSWEVP